MSKYSMNIYLQVSQVKNHLYKTVRFYLYYNKKHILNYVTDQYRIQIKRDGFI